MHSCALGLRISLPRAQTDLRDLSVDSSNDMQCCANQSSPACPGRRAARSHQPGTPELPMSMAATPWLGGARGRRSRRPAAARACCSRAPPPRPRRRRPQALPQAPPQALRQAARGAGSRAAPAAASGASSTRSGPGAPAACPAADSGACRVRARLKVHPADEFVTSHMPSWHSGRLPSERPSSVLVACAGHRRLQAPCTTA